MARYDFGPSLGRMIRISGAMADTHHALAGDAKRAGVGRCGGDAVR